MSEKRFEDDGVKYTNNYNYALLDTYYEFDDEKIIEWNKHSDNAQYTDLERITEILNIKQMQLESLMEHREEIGKLLDRIEEQQVIISALKEENEILKKQKSMLDKFLYVRECECERLKEKNEQLKSRIAFFEEQEDEFEKYTAQTIQNMIADYREG